MQISLPRPLLRSFPWRTFPWRPLLLGAHWCAASLAMGAEPAEYCPPEPRCCDAFRHPLPELIEGPAYSRKEIDALRTRQDAQGDVHLEGDVRIRYDRRQLEAGRARINAAGDEAQLSDGVRFAEPGFVIEGDKATLRIDNGDGALSNLRYTLFDATSQGSAESLRREGATLHLKDAVWSSCPPQREWWRIRAAEMRIDQEAGYITARHLRFLVGRTPVLYLPWIGFPAGEVRHTGLLQPNISYSRSDGIDWSQPLYLNLAPNYDLLLTPRYIDERGELLEGEFRWLLPHLKGELHAAHIDQDRADNDARRWLYRFNLKEHRSEHWDAFVRYAKSSDANYLYDLGSSRPPYLEQRGAVQYANRNWLLRLESIDYQPLRGSEEEAFYRQQPAALFRWRGGGAPFRPEYSLRAEYSDFQAGAALESEAGTLQTSGDTPVDAAQASTVTRRDGSRLYAEAELAWPMRHRGAHLRPWLKVLHLEHSPEHERNRRITALSAGLSASAQLERSIATNGGALRQTLEPQLLYLHTRERATKQQGLPVFESGVREFTPQQLFRQSRFSGRDRIADAHRLSLALQTRLIDEHSGRELLRVQLGQIFYFEDRETFLDEDLRRDPALSTSPFALQWDWRPSAHWLWRGEAIVDDRGKRFDAGLWELRYQTPTDGLRLHLLHRYDRFHPDRGEALEQARLHLSLPRGDWRFFGNWEYDIQRSQDILAEGGFRFSGCCWTAGLRWDRTLEDAGEWDNSVSFEFSLHGIGARRAD